MVGCLLIVYFVVCELMVVVGLMSFGGYLQMVCLLLVLMVEGVVENCFGKLLVLVCECLLVFCVVIDNVGLFFGEDIFVVFGVIVLMYMFLFGLGIDVELLYIVVWGILIVVCVFLIYLVCFKCLDGWFVCEMGVVVNINVVVVKQG